MVCSICRSASCLTIGAWLTWAPENLSLAHRTHSRHLKCGTAQLHTPLWGLFLGTRGGRGPGNLGAEAILLQYCYMLQKLLLFCRYCNLTGLHIHHPAVGGLARKKTEVHKRAHAVWVRPSPQRILERLTWRMQSQCAMRRRHSNVHSSPEFGWCQSPSHPTLGEASKRSLETRDLRRVALHGNNGNLRELRKSAWIFPVGLPWAPLQTTVYRHVAKWHIHWWQAAIEAHPWLSSVKGRIYWSQNSNPGHLHPRTPWAMLPCASWCVYDCLCSSTYTV